MSSFLKKIAKSVVNTFSTPRTGNGRMKAIALSNNVAMMSNVGAKKGLLKPGRYPFSVLRSIAYVDAITRISINVIKKTVSQSRWQIKVKDRYKKNENAEELYKKEIEEAYELFENMNDQEENMRILLERVIEDILVLDSGAIEIIRSKDGKKIVQLNSVDGASIRPVLNIYGEQGDVAYTQVIDEVECASFSKDDLVYIMANPQNSIEGFGYGLSPIESIIIQVQASLEAEMYNMKTFSSNNVPAGLLDLGEATDEEAENIIATWNATVIGNTEAMKFIWGSGADRKFTAFQKSNKDMQFSQYIEWLSRIKLATFGLTAQDANIDVDLNRSTAEVHASMSNARGVKSMKRLLEEYFTRKIIRKMGDSDNYKKIEFAFIDIETLGDKETQAKIDKTNIESGIYAPQFVQERDGYPIKDNNVDEEFNMKLSQLIETEQESAKKPLIMPKKVYDEEDEE